MHALAEMIRKTRLLTFDCYGTLIDWRQGIRDSLAPVLESAGLMWDDALFDLYLDCEARCEAPPYRSYREVLALAEAAVLTHAGLHPPPAPCLADRLPGWLPFPDTVPALWRLRRRFALGLLTNIDADLLQPTLHHLKVEFQVIVTAQDVRAYKPDPAHFRRLLRDSGLEPGEILHVAQSVFHDIRPATELGIPAVWINRHGEPAKRGAGACAMLGDLRSFAEAVVLPDR